ncbi:MAG: Rid family hydrolase [Spirochaetia bacterium]
MMKRLTLSSLVIGIMALAAVGLSQRSSDIRYINLPGRTDNLPWSNAVLAGDTLYLSGKIGIVPDTREVPPEIQQEVKIILDSMKERLEVVGMTMDDLVWVQVLCPDISLYDEFNSIYRTYFKDHFPARAFLGSGSLLRGAHFEVMGIAVKR